MKILIDGDACSVIDKAEEIAAKYNIDCHIFCDTKHSIRSDYSDVHIVDAGQDSTDFAIVNNCQKDDIVITNDGGLAAMILAKKAYALNNKGVYYTDANIMTTLTKRYMRSQEIKHTNKRQCKGLYKAPPSNYSFGHALKYLIYKSTH